MSLNIITQSQHKPINFHILFKTPVIITIIKAFAILFSVQVNSIKMLPKSQDNHSNYYIVNPKVEDI